MFNEKYYKIGVNKPDSTFETSRISIRQYISKACPLKKSNSNLKKNNTNTRKPEMLTEPASRSKHQLSKVCTEYIQHKALHAKLASWIEHNNKHV
jgi:hypothetical protein